MALTALARLLGRCELSFEEIGRLECGTESGVDRGKSTKSFLMSFFEACAHHDVQGADTVNACYGGTNALFSTTNWIHGPGWSGGYGAVICSDPAVHPGPAHLAGIGASAVSLLAGPRACLTIEDHRSTFVKHAWDFYRPVGWVTNDALMDVVVATAQYEEAMLWCQGRFDHRGRDLLLVYDQIAYHCNAPYHAKRNLRLMCEFMYERPLTKEDHEGLYRGHVWLGTAISAQNATTYTCPLYACLLSLVAGGTHGQRRILCMSYGSGCAASMFAFAGSALPTHPSDVLERLKRRKPKTVADTLALVGAFECTHGRFGFVPSHVIDREAGAYFLAGVASTGVREYLRRDRRDAVLRVSSRDDDVTRIEFLRPFVDATLLGELMPALEARRSHVLVPCECFDEGLGSPSELALIRRVLVRRDLWIATICASVMVDRLMLFLALSDLAVATAHSRFGFPGNAPGAASAALVRRVSSRCVRRWVLMREVFDACSASRSSLVDTIVE